MSTKLAVKFLSDPHKRVSVAHPGACLRQTAIYRDVVMDVEDMVEEGAMDAVVVLDIDTEVIG